MKKIKKGTTLMILFAMFLIPSFISAASKCSSEEQIQLQKEAINVNASYEIVTKVEDLNGNIVEGVDPEEAGPYTEYRTRDFVYVTVRNITDNIYVEINNLTENKKETIRYEDTDDGSYTFQVPDKTIIREYQIRVLSSMSSCRGEEVHSSSFKTPKSNPLANYPACLKIDEYYCEPYVTQEVYMTPEGLDEKYQEILAKEQQESEKEEEKKDNKWIFWGISIGIIGLLLILGLLYIIRRTQRSKII